jgi:sulfite reductase alpha subunit-like flavoprotein
VSREAGRPRRHVQDLVAEHGQLIHQLWFQEGGSLYVSGKIAMARCVREQLVAAVAAAAGLDREEAAARVEQCREQGRFQEDIFTS